MVTMWAAYWTTGRLRGKFWLCTIANVCTGNRWVLLHKQHGGKYSSTVFYHSFSLMSYFVSSAMPGLCWQSIPHIFLVTCQKASEHPPKLLKTFAFSQWEEQPPARSSLGNSTGMPGLGSHCASVRASDKEPVWHKPGCNTWGTEQIPHLCTETGDINTA